MPGTQSQGATSQPGLSIQNRWGGRFASAIRTSQVKHHYVITVAFSMSPFLSPPAPPRMS